MRERRGHHRRRALAAALLALFGCVAASAPVGAAPQDKRVVGGVVADPADWPWAAALMQGGSQFCGGTVIAPRSVLTAAHCVYGNFAPFRVVTGRPDLSDNGEGESIRAKHAFTHPTFPSGHDHDVAVVRLREPTSAPAIALPTREQDSVETGPGAVLRVAGWGSTAPEGNAGSDVLLETVQNALAPGPCNHAFADFGGDEEICTRGEPISGDSYTSSCYGDSGGPLMADSSPVPLLVGVVSYGARRCGVRKPSVYARVADALGFIRGHAGLE